MELNFIHLIKSARCFIDKDSIEADYFVSLALLKTPDIITKIEALGIKSFINYKLKNINELLVIIKKIRKMNISLRNLDNNSSFILVKIYYRTAMLLKDNGELYLSIYFIYEAMKILDEKNNDDSESYCILIDIYEKLQNDIKIEVRCYNLAF